MTNPTPHGQVPEVLIDLIDAYAEARHRCGGIYNAKTDAARKAVIEALSGVQALSAAPAGPWSLGEMTGNWRDIDLPDHGAVMRIVWKMEDDDGRNAKLEAQAHAVVAALNAASSTPPAEQQAGATTSETVPFVDKSTADPVEKARRYLTAMGDNRLHSTYFFDDGFPKQESASDALATLAILEQLAAPQQEAQKPVGWDGAEEWEKLAWHLCADENGEDACNELIWEGGPMPEPWGDRWLKYEGEARRMIALVRTHVPAPQHEAQEPVAWQGVHDQTDLYYTKPAQADARPLYTTPQPAPAPLSDDVVKDAARYRWLIDQHWIQTEVDWRLISTDQDSTIKQLDAAIDAALAAQGGKA